MYYDVIIVKIDRFVIQNRVLSKIKTFSMVKCLCKKEIKSKFYYVYIRKVEKELVTNWKIILNLSDYFSNLHNPPEYFCQLLDDIFKKELKNA